MQIDRTNTSMANIANTGKAPVKQQVDSSININDSFGKSGETAWKNFQMDQNITVVRHQIASDKSKSKLYSMVTKGFVALGAASMIGGAVVSAAISAPILGLGLMGVGLGSIFMGGKTYRISEGLEMRSMLGESKVFQYELEKMGNNLGIEK